jgi:SAM-dependent methyltransferase
MNSPDRQTPSFWHERFLQQARWTHAIRQQLFQILKGDHLTAVLEVGSGTGVIVKELAHGSSARIVGVDLDFERLQFSRHYAPECSAITADGVALPFEDHAFDASVCHFLLLWVDDPTAILQEMVRATRPKGWVMAMAEPDYGGRIDHPPALEVLGEMQRASLASQGADPQIGRRLRTLFLQTGLVEIQAGVLGGQWSENSRSRESLEGEWSIIEADIAHLQTHPSLDQFKMAWFDPGRILYVPTFYVLGRVPG